jgi:dTDP-L-rhamnose 4-epimerase
MYQPLHYVHTNGCGSAILLEQVVRHVRQFRKLVVASSMSLYGEGAYRCGQCGATKAGVRTRERIEARLFEVPCQACGGDLEPQPTPEEKEPALSSVYAATKKHQEDLFTAIGRAYAVPTFALRFFNVIGPRQSLSNPYTGVAAIFLSRLLNARAPLLFEDGRQSRDLVDVRDVAEALLLAVEHDDGGVHVLNVGTGRRTSILELAETLARHLGVDAAPQLLGQCRTGDVRHCFADPAQARKELGFAARHSLEASLPELIEWCRREIANDAVEPSLRELTDRGLVR